MIPLFGRVFNRAGADDDVELGKRQRESNAQGMEEIRAHYYPWSSATQEGVNFAQSPPGQVPHPWSPTDQPTQSSHQQFDPSSSSFNSNLQSHQPPPGQVPPPPWSPTDQPPSLSFNSNLQSHHCVASGNGPVSAQPIPQNITVATLPRTPQEPFNRLAVPSFATGTSRSRSNSRSSRQSSRRNTPAPTPDQAAEQHQAAINKVRVVGIEDPTKIETIAAQTSTIQHLRNEASLTINTLAKKEQRWNSIQAQLDTVEERAEKAEQKTAEAERKAAEAERRMAASERKAMVAQKNAAEAEKNVDETRKRIAEAEKALEAEKIWADERVKMVEKNGQQEMENRLREAKKQAAERQRVEDIGWCEAHSTANRGGLNIHDSGPIINHTDGTRQDNVDRCSEIAKTVPETPWPKWEDESHLPTQMQMSPDFGHFSESVGERSGSLPQVDKGKSRQVDQGPQQRPLNSSAIQSQVSSIRLWMYFVYEFVTLDIQADELCKTPSRRKEAPRSAPPPPRLNFNHSDDEIEATRPETFQQIRSFANLGLHEKLEAVLDSNRKMAEMLDNLCAKGPPQSPYRPRRRADPDLKMPAVRPPRNPQRNAALKFIRIHLHDLLGISRAEDMLKHKDHIYSLNTPLKRAMAAYEEHGTGVGPSLKPIMHVNWDKFDGKWNSELCSKFIVYLVENGYADGQPTDEEQQIATNIFWEQLERLHEVVKENRPKENETEEQTSARIAERQKEERAKASKNSRRKNTFHDRIDTCLLHIESEGIDDDEKQAWKNHFAVIQELGIEGMSSDEPDDDDPLVFHVRTLPWRARELTKTCVQTDLARNTTNAYGNRRAGNLPRTRKRRKTGRTSSRKAPAGKPLNFYDPEWYRQLGVRQKKLAAKAPMEILDSEFDS